jgi:hypothetical protein
MFDTTLSYEYSTRASDRSTPVPTGQSDALSADRLLSRRKRFPNQDRTSTSPYAVLEYVDVKTTAQMLKVTSMSLFTPLIFSCYTLYCVRGAALAWCCKQITAGLSSFKKVVRGVDNACPSA